MIKLFGNDIGFLIVKTFPVVFWCAESEYERKNSRKSVFLLQNLGEMSLLC